MDKIFEGICREAYVRHHETWGLPGALEWTRWEGRDRNRRPIEADTVARLDDGRILAGEVKWSAKPIAAAVHTDLMRDLENLAASGQGWAKDALSSTRSVGHLHHSATGFFEDFRKHAAADARLRFISLDALYARKMFYLTVRDG
jgi:hypothetical protein